MRVQPDTLDGYSLGSDDSPVSATALKLKGGTPVKLEAAAAFESIESAQEYFELLAEVVLESQQAVQADIQGKANSGSPRHVEALRLIGFKLERLAFHIKTSRRILNDLRMLRRVIYQRDGGGRVND